MKCVESYIFLSIFLFFLFLFSAAGCATSNPRKDLGLPETSKGKQILLMPVDILLGTTTVSGLIKPKAKWTQTACKNVESSIRNKLNEKGIRLLTFEDIVGVHLNTAEQKKFDQLIKLHEKVRDSILMHQFNSRYELPANEEGYYWSLGPEAGLIKQKYGVDYALFLYLRVSYASTGRKLVSAVGLMSAVFLPFGQQLGIASLVDLNTGNVIWFNRMDKNKGDLRTPEDSDSAVNILMEGL